jgi:hypothetical protein
MEGKNPYSISMCIFDQGWTWQSEMN